MKRKALIALIISSCVVVVGCVGLVFWAFAATQVNVKTSLTVTYKPEKHVVCDVSATYQRANDSSPIPFEEGTLNLIYGGESTEEQLNANSDGLILDDNNRYVLFEFTFTNKNLMGNFHLNVTLQDNSICKNMTRKYFFGTMVNYFFDISTLSGKRDFLLSKNNPYFGLEQDEIVGQSISLGYQETEKIYMILEITPGIVASYDANEVTSFVFTLTTQEVEDSAYLSKDWKTRVGYIDNFVNPDTYLGPEISFTNDILQTSGLTNMLSVGTINKTSTSAYMAVEGISDVMAYWGDDKTKIVIYSPSTIYAPEDSSSLFSLYSTYGGFDYPFYLRGLDLSNFDTSKVMYMSCMFAVYASNNTLDLSNFNTSNVVDMTYMFAVCGASEEFQSGLKVMNLTSFNTSNVRSMQSMFSGCSIQTNIDISSFNFSKVTSMAEMFGGCSSIQSIVFNNFDTINVRDFAIMFANCSSLINVNIDNFNTSKVKNLNSMFLGCASLNNLNLGNFNLASCTNVTNMLSGCSALASITLPYNLQSGKTISLPASTYYNGSAGPYSKIGTATSGTTVACSTADTKVTLTKR